MISMQRNKVEHDLPRREPEEVQWSMNPVIEAALTDNYRVFLQFLVRRLRDKSTAEDVLQSFCLRAVRKGAELRDSESAIAWLYSVLRSVLMDYYRSEAARQRREACYAQEQALLDNDRDYLELEESVCDCFRGLLPELRPDYTEVLRRIDLSGDTHDKVAADLGITLTNVRVRLHRARQALRKELESCCGSCCEHGFHDCDCQSAHDRANLAPSREAAFT